MTYEFITEDGVVLTRKFRTISAAIAHFESPDNPDTYESVPDPSDPNKVATRIYGYAGNQFYGEGWDKPAPSGKQFTKGVDASKAMSNLGRPTNTSFMGRS